MTSFSKKSSVYISYIVVNFWWYVSCVFGILFPILMVIEYVKGTHPSTIMGINVPLSTSLVTLKESTQSNYLAIRSAQGQVDFDYIMQHNPQTFVLWAAFICLVIWLFLFGLFQLRSLLKSSVDDTVFSQQNIRRIKTIAVLVLLIEPLQWIEHHFILQTLGDIIPGETADVQLYLMIPFGNWSFIILGLLIFALAAIFEKGHKMYQELKLTV